jgi:hypothetical protein
MKDYPSIPGSNGQEFREFDAFVFDKADGSNLRAELSIKRGFYKFGTRHRMFDESDPVFGFKSVWQDRLIKLTKDNKWESVIIFCEFHGPKSFAGYHDSEDNKTLTLFDICPHKHGFIGPKEYIKLVTPFEQDCAAFIGNYKWTRGFVQEVRDNKIPGVTFEGVVGKAGDGHKIIRAKAKTQLWIDKVKSKYLPDEAEKIICS